jgi:hypothetical protein
MKVVGRDILIIVQNQPEVDIQPFVDEGSKGYSDHRPKPSGSGHPALRGLKVLRNILIIVQNQREVYIQPFMDE